MRWTGLALLLASLGALAGCATAVPAMSGASTTPKNRTDLGLGGAAKPPSSHHGLLRNAPKAPATEARTPAATMSNVPANVSTMNTGCAPAGELQAQSERSYGRSPPALRAEQSAPARHVAPDAPQKCTHDERPEVTPNQERAAEAHAAQGGGGGGCEPKAERKTTTRTQ